MFTYYPTVKKTEADARNERRRSYTDTPSDPILFLGRSVETRRGGQPTSTSNQVIGNATSSRPFFYVPPSTESLMDRSIQYMKPPLPKPIDFSSTPVLPPTYTFMKETRTRSQTTDKGLK